MNKIGEQEHKLLAIWAADCAQHVLSYFEKNYSHDNRPSKAIEAVRAWVRGELKMSEARKFAFAAHAAARDAKSPESKAAARAAAHAAATPHVATHARYAACYALQAIIDTTSERDWQLQQLPAHLHPIVLEWGKKDDKLKHSFNHFSNTINNTNLHFP
jgi:hypothetical protein